MIGRYASKILFSRFILKSCSIKLADRESFYLLMTGDNCQPGKDFNMKAEEKA